MSGIDWDAIFWEARGYLGLEENDPVPRDELLETAIANGWSEREFKQGLRRADRIEFTDGLGGDLQLVDDDESDEPESDVDDEDVVEGSENTNSDAAGDLERVDLDLAGSTTGYPSTLYEDGQRWLLWQYRDDRKIPRNPSWGLSEDDDAESGEWSLAGAKDPRAWFDFDGASRWTGHDDSLGLAYYLVSPDRDDWDDDEKYDWVDVDEDVPVESHTGLADFDNIRDRETGEIAPKAVPWLERFGITFCEWSPSGTGAHALGSFELPEGAKELHIDVSDEDWPDAEIEVYAGRRYTTVTGQQIPGSADDIEDAQAVIDALVEEYPDAVQAVTSNEDRNPEPYNPGKTRDELADIDVTHDYDDVIDAVNQLQPSDLPLKSTYVDDENDDFESWDPGYRTSSSGRSLKHGGDGQFIDMKKMQTAFGVLSLFAAEQRIISNPWDDLKKGDFREAVEKAREKGAPIPKYEPNEAESAYKRNSDARHVSALPIALLDSLEPAERRRYAKRRGLHWPTTEDAREELFDTIADVLRHEDERVVDAPTSLGKSHTIASTRWAARDDLTGERPVVHLLETRDARDEAVDVAEKHGGQYIVLLGRHEACPVAAGEHDDQITVDGMAASEFFDAVCDGRGVPFSAAHRYLEEHNDQGRQLPCSEDGPCEAIAQWERYREGPNGDLDYWPLVIATHNFAYAPGIRMSNNVVVDEQPTYETDLSTDRIRDAVGAFLREIDAPVTTWEAFIQLSLHEGYGGDAAAERDALEDVLYKDPDREWYFEEPDAHTLAPALARAIFRAEERANGRRFGKTGHNPPRLEAAVRDADEWNREWVSVVLDETNDVRSVRVVPDFGAARSVVGLDAHPALPLWQANTLPWIKTKDVLESEERQLWRRYERGLRVVQVGDATRPLSGDKALEWLNDDKLEVLLEHLVDEYGTQFRTAITTAQVEDRLEELMEEAGCHRPELMHFGAEKSRNDFKHERVGLVNGCMDPGDDYVLDLLAELDLEAEVETAVDDDGEEYRARGRGFDGPDAETAQSILASVRENHIAQSAGRYARDPTDPDVYATVFVRTDAMPPGFADVQVPGVEWVMTDLQEAIVDELRSSTGAKTAREIADVVGCTKEHVRKTLKRLTDPEFGEPSVQRFEGGENGAHLYSATGQPHSGVCDIQESPTPAYWDSSRWSLAIRSPETDTTPDQGVNATPGGSDSEVWDWKAGPGHGG